MGQEEKRKEDALRQEVSALAEKLAARDPARYGEAVERLRLKAERAAQRRQAPRKRPGRKKK